MAAVLIVDWLGRGGIAHTTEAWRRAGLDSGIEVKVLSRPSDGSLVADRLVTKRLPGLPGALDVHARLARAAVDEIAELRPDVVFLQNYWCPPIELPVATAAARRGSRVVLAVHNHKPHGLRAGTAVGLARLINAADTVVTHSEFVGAAVRSMYHRPTVQVPLPIQVGVLDHAPHAIEEVESRLDGRPVALLFGMLSRSYKGASMIPALGKEVSDDWLLIAAGVGARHAAGAEVSLDRYLRDAELHWLVQLSSVALLPYRAATQSGAVVLAQALASPPVATAVGGIPEQVVDRSTGILLPRSADSAQWAQALKQIANDAAWWARVQHSSVEHAWAQHELALAQWTQLVGT